MARALQNAILITWRRNGAYGLRLVDGIPEAQFAAQPIPGRTLNHPAWVLSHLTLYTTVCSALLRSSPFVDPIDHPHGQKSEPLGRAAYPSGAQLIEAYRLAHEDAEAALNAAGDAVMAMPTPIDRWRALHPTVGDMLVTLMVKHESSHLGQLSAWRRAMGLPRVAL